MTPFLPHGEQILQADQVSESGNCFNALITISPRIREPMAEQWHLAMDHAGLSEGEVHLIGVPGLPGPRTPKAATYPATWKLEREIPGRAILDAAALQEANRPGVIEKHRVAIFTGYPERDPVDIAVVGGKLRHELRHVEQRKLPAWTELFELEYLAHEIAELKGQVDGGGVFYTLVPTEADANAASAEFLRQEHPGALKGLLAGDDGALARSATPPGAIADLPAKLVAFIFIFREIAEDPASFPGESFEHRLDVISPRASETWAALLRAT